MAPETTRFEKESRLPTTIFFRGYVSFREGNGSTTPQDNTRTIFAN